MSLHQHFHFGGPGGGRGGGVGRTNSLKERQERRKAICDRAFAMMMAAHRGEMGGMAVDGRALLERLRQHNVIAMAYPYSYLQQATQKAQPQEQEQAQQQAYIYVPGSWNNTCIAPMDIDEID